MKMLKCVRTFGAPCTVHTVPTTVTVTYCSLCIWQGVIWYINTCIPIFDAHTGVRHSTCCRSPERFKVFCHAFLCLGDPRNEDPSNLTKWADNSHALFPSPTSHKNNFLESKLARWTHDFFLSKPETTSSIEWRIPAPRWCKCLRPGQPDRQTYSTRQEP